MRPDRRAAPTPGIVFLHIPRTGGMTLRQVLARHVPRDRVLTIDAADARSSGGRLEDIRLVQGHTRFGIHSLLPGEWTYLTMLRDPVARMVSEYHYIRRTAAHPLHRLIGSDGVSLAEFAKLAPALRLDNRQTRALAGPPYGAQDARDPLAAQELLDAATANMDRWFLVVGLTERFADSVALLASEVGLTRLHYTTVNATPDVTPMANDRDRSAVLRCNRLDRQLYTLAAQRFADKVEAESTLPATLARLRRQNLVRRPARLVRFTIPARILAATRKGPAAPGASDHPGLQNGR